jgi:hypothetical protein
MKKIGIAFIGLVILTMLLVPKVANADGVEDFLADFPHLLVKYKELLEKAEYSVNGSAELWEFLYLYYPGRPVKETDGVQ